MKKILLIGIAFNIFFLYGCSNENNNKIAHHEKGQKIAKVYESDNEYLTQIALMRGHLHVGIELYKNGYIDNAKRHMKHPKSELYSDIIPTFKAKNSEGFTVELENLASAVEGEEDFKFISSKMRLFKFLYAVSITFLLLSKISFCNLIERNKEFNLLALVQLVP